MSVNDIILAGIVAFSSSSESPSDATKNLVRSNKISKKRKIFKGAFKRKDYIDNIRWAGVMAVVLFHVLFMYTNVGILGSVMTITNLKVQYYDLYIYIVYPFIMILMFMISGICARFSITKHSTGEYILDKTKRFLIPSTIGLCTFWFIQGFFMMCTKGFRDFSKIPLLKLYLLFVRKGICTLWYLHLLWLYSVVLVLFRLVEKDRLYKLCSKANLLVLALTSLVVFKAGQYLNNPKTVTYRVGLFFASYLTGYYLLSHEKLIESLKKWIMVFLRITIGLGTIFCNTYFGKDIIVIPSSNRSFLYLVYGYFASITMIGISAKYWNTRNKFTRWMNRKSYAIYMFHYLGIMVAVYFFKTYWRGPALIIYSATLLAGLLTPAILYPIISRIPVYRLLVLGEFKKKKATKSSSAKATA